MDNNSDSEDFDLERLYSKSTVADGTVFYLDYFYHAVYLRYALHEIQILFMQEREKPVSIASNNISLGLFFTLIFLTSQTIENLIKARSLYDLYKHNKLKEYPTLKLVINKVWKCNGHDILKIIRSSNIKITIKEDRLIKDIEPFFIWGGRFPHPYSRNEYVNNALNNIQVNYSYDRVKIIDNMFKRFAEEMELSHYLHLPVNEDK